MIEDPLQEYTTTVQMDGQSVDLTVFYRQQAGDIEINDMQSQAGNFVYPGKQAHERIKDEIREMYVRGLE